MTAAEREAIERRAKQTGKSVSGFLRAVGLNEPIAPTVDMDAVRTLARLHADLGRVGGLLKLWLSERRGEGAHPVDVNRVLNDLRATQRAIMEASHGMTTKRRR